MEVSQYPQLKQRGPLRRGFQSASGFSQSRQSTDVRVQLVSGTQLKQPHRRARNSHFLFRRVCQICDSARRNEERLYLWVNCGCGCARPPWLAQAGHRHLSYPPFASIHWLPFDRLRLTGCWQGLNPYSVRLSEVPRIKCRLLARSRLRRQPAN